MIAPFRVLSLVALALWYGLAPASAEPRDLDDLLAKYSCEVYDRLERIHATPPTPHERFLVVSMPAARHAYVQCLFERGDTHMICEIASGYFYDVPRTIHLPKATIAAIGRLGYSTDDSHGNFAIEFAVPQPADIARIADLMLTSLHVAYGANGTTDLAFDAPYAMRASGACTPTG